MADNHGVVEAIRRNSAPLMEKRGAIYSDRPRLIMAELAGWGEIPIMFPHGEKLRTSRKLLNDMLGQRNIIQWQALHVQMARRFTRQVLEHPGDWKKHLRLMVGSTAIKTPTGLDIENHDDPILRLAEEAVGDIIASIEPGVFIVEVLPFLRHLPDWVPDAGFKKRAQEWIVTAAQFRDHIYESVSAGLDQGEVNDSFLGAFIRDHPDADDELKKRYQRVAWIAHLEGVDTVYAALLWFCHAMMAFPEVQQTAHQELTDAVGLGNLPSFEDREHLPYNDALVKEVFRWYPVTPLGIPHRVRQDDVYNGYHIPANSIVIGNAWAMLHDPSVYPDPFVFRPERYLAEDKDGINPDPRSQGAFGYGRRLCPGQHLAGEIMFMSIATILAVFTIEAPLDEHGMPYVPALKVENGIASSPAGLECRFVPRLSDVN